LAHGKFGPTVEAVNYVSTECVVGEGPQDIRGDREERQNLAALKIPSDEGVACARAAADLRLLHMVRYLSDCADSMCSKLGSRRERPNCVTVNDFNLSTYLDYGGGA
jgi:hypothetical protein